MTMFLLFPGEAVCYLAGLRQDDDHGLILRMFVNTLVWGAIAVVTVLITAL
jgi:hypothetical protein